MEKFPNRHKRLNPHLRAFKSIGISLVATSTFMGSRDFVNNGKSRGWLVARERIDDVLALGIREGTLVAKEALTVRQQQKLNEALGLQGGIANPNEADDDSKQDSKKGNEASNIPVNDDQLIHQAIPFLPLPAAVTCLIVNIVLPGIGTILSGFFLLCVGYPRLQVKENRILKSILINFIIGISQLATITFCLVGWGWSIAWGAILLTHSIQYRNSIKDTRKAQVATAALEALTQDSLLRRRDVKALVKDKPNPDGNGCSIESGRRASITSQTSEIAIDVEALERCSKTERLGVLKSLKGTFSKILQYKPRRFFKQKEHSDSPSETNKPKDKSNWSFRGRNRKGENTKSGNSENAVTSQPKRIRFCFPKHSNSDV